jgi:hypothetical protein
VEEDTQDDLQDGEYPCDFGIESGTDQEEERRSDDHPVQRADPEIG